MRTCESCRFLVYPTLMGYACRKRKLWGNILPLFFDSIECKKWKRTNRKDDANRAFIAPEERTPRSVTIIKGKSYVEYD